MTLRRKLLSGFFALALASFSCMGVTLYSTVAQRAKMDEQTEHYVRSVLLLRLRSQSGKLYNQAVVALLSEDDAARARFEQHDAEIRELFVIWSDHVASAGSERAREDALQAYDELYEWLGRGMAMAPAEPSADEEGVSTESGVVEDEVREHYRQFQARVDDAMDSNQRALTMTKEKMRALRHTIQLAVAGAATVTLSIVLLLVAWLGADIFRPLEQVREALRALATGDLTSRLPAGRRDELGRVNDQFNSAMAALSGGAVGERSEAEDTSRRALREAVRAVEQALTQPPPAEGDPSASAPATAPLTLDAAARALLERVRARERIQHPVELALAWVDLHGLLSELLARHYGALGARGVGLRLSMPSGPVWITADPLRLRDALLDLFAVTLNGQPARGGRLELELSHVPQGSRLRLLSATTPTASALDATLRNAEELFAAHGATFDAHRDRKELTLTVTFPLPDPLLPRPV